MTSKLKIQRNELKEKDKSLEIIKEEKEKIEKKKNKIAIEKKK